MPINTDPRYISRAWITPDGPVVAGQYGTWTLGYEVGAYGYDEDGAQAWTSPVYLDVGSDSDF
jgi:hypothetical protein